MMHVTYWGKVNSAMACFVSHHWPGNNVAVKRFCEIPFILLILRPLVFCAAIYLKKILALYSGI
jgi:hypothetical protein